MGGNLRLEDPTAWIKAMDFVRTEFSGCEKTIQQTYAANPEDSFAGKS